MGVSIVVFAMVGIYQFSSLVASYFRKVDLDISSECAHSWGSFEKSLPLRKLWNNNKKRTPYQLYAFHLSNCIGFGLRFDCNKCSQKWA